MPDEAPPLKFEGIIGYSAGTTEQAAHFFEHTLGLQLSAEEPGMRFYPLSEDLCIAVDVSGRAAGEPPYLLFSTSDLVAAGEHFLQRGCAIRPLSWAPEGAGFLARSPEGHTVCVVDESALGDA
jgi:hypothetical protein